MMFATVRYVVSWEGVDIPVCLREHEDRLYMIGFDRQTDPSKCRLKFYAQEDNSFVLIESSEFPKVIATQNMSFPSKRSKGRGRQGVDKLQMTRDLNPEDGYFMHTLTSKIWIQLETGKEYWEQDDISVHATTNALIQYVQKYKPIALPTIVKEDQAPAEAEEKTGE